MDCASMLPFLKATPKRRSSKYTIQDTRRIWIFIIQFPLQWVIDNIFPDAV